MSGRNRSIFVGFMSGARVAGQLTYIPAHIKNGERRQARCLIPVFVNGRGESSHNYMLQSWGKMADICARSLSSGKALDATLRPSTYRAPAYDQNGNLRYDNQGQVIEMTRVVFNIGSDIAFGEESNKHIQNEIQTGVRPPHWDSPGHPDQQKWTQILEARNTSFWDGKSPKFGFARVVKPFGNNIQLLTGEDAYGQGQGQQGFVNPNAGGGYNQGAHPTPAPTSQNAFGNGQPVQNAFGNGQPVQNAFGNEQPVQNAFGNEQGGGYVPPAQGQPAQNNTVGTATLY